MKKFMYVFLAIFFATVTVLPAQNQTACAGKAVFQHTIAGNSASFFSQAANAPLRHSWSFGDGIGSTIANPVHVYPQPGTYLVKHYVYSDSISNCVDSSFKSIVIGGSNLCDSLRPKFTWYRDSVYQNRVYFINQTLPNAPPSPISYHWTFGDGTTSNEKNPVHNYTIAGQYLVCLSVQYATINCTQQYCIMVTVGTPCNLQPNFTSAPDPANPLKVKFTNQTIVPINNAQVRWSFGDGTSSNEWSPSHVYAQPGNYNVCLKVGISDSCVKEICKQVTVVRACTIVPAFTWVTDTIYPLRGVQFINQTPIADSSVAGVKWSFGDGKGSTAWSPFHQYEQAGTYTVCLKIEFYGGCVKETCKTIVIQDPINCERLSDFTFRPAANEPNVFYFTANVNNATLKYVWTFGDGTGAFIPNARHLFSKPGKYTVCLTVYRGENCASTTCKEIVVGPLSCALTTVKFEYQRLNSIGNSIKFTAVGNQPIISQRWTIQMLNSQNQIVINTNNPTYTFTDTGFYKVCLRAITGNGCVKEYCEVIRIQNVPQQCTLQVTPNPAITQITFKTELQQQGPVVASIIDALGVRRAVFYLQGVQGVNSFTLPVANLPVGFYTLEVLAGGRICKGRFQKIN
jgi:PKD repeat protein